MGDLDDDGAVDLAVGVSDDDGGNDRGAIWILFLHKNGTVKRFQKISNTQGNFAGILNDNDWFGVTGLASLGDLDGDGVIDLAVGALYDDDGGTNRGAVWVLFLNQDGTVKSHQKISDTYGDFTGVLDSSDTFGASLAPMGDVDGDGVIDLAVGASADDDGGSNRGAVWLLFLNADGTVKAHQKMSNLAGNFSGALSDGDTFGYSLSSLGDLDGDGVTDLAVSARADDDGGTNRGAIYLCMLYPDGQVKHHYKISAYSDTFGTQLADNDYLGRSLTNMGDLNGDGVTDLVAGTRDDDGGTDRGALFFLNLNGEPDPQYISIQVDENLSADSNSNISIPVKAKNLTPYNAISYFFECHYDPLLLTYQGASSVGTLSANGQLIVNEPVPGQVHVSYLGSDPLADEGDLVNLEFLVKPDLVNDTCAPLSIENLYFDSYALTALAGSFCVTDCEKGDITGDGTIQISDAYQIMNHLVGIPTVYDPLPLCSADTDCNGSIQINDAASIQRYLAGTLPSFCSGAKTAIQPEYLAKASWDAGPYRVLPVRVSNAEGLRAVAFGLAYDPKEVRVLGVQPTGRFGPDWELLGNQAKYGLYRVSGLAFGATYGKGALFHVLYRSKTGAVPILIQE